MSDVLDREFLWLLGGVLGVLVVASIAGALLARRVTSDSERATIANLNARIRAWWVMSAVFAFRLLPTRNAIAGDTERFLERTATIQWALMICVYCVSYAPALLTLHIKGYENDTGKLLLFLVIVVETSDVFQYVWGKLFGRHRIAPTVSPNKTWEGFLGGIATATVIGTALWWVTSFAPWQAALMS